MIAKHNNQYYRCVWQNQKPVLLSAKQEDGFEICLEQAFWRKECEIKAIDELFEICYQVNWHGHWFEVFLAENITDNGNVAITLWDDDLSFDCEIGKYANDNGFTVFMSDNGVSVAWIRDVNLSECDAFKTIISYKYPHDNQTIKEVSKDEFLEIYHKFQIDLESDER